MTLRRLALLASMLLGIAAMARAEYVSGVPDDEEDPYFLLCGQADQAIAEGDYSEAAARLIDAMAVRPDAPENVMLMSNLGMLYCYMDRDSLALATLDEAHRRAPAMRTVLSNRAKVLLKMGRDNDALKDFSAVISADSLNAEARFYRGTIALYSRDLATAEADLEILRRAEPKSTRTAEALSALYSLTGRDREAIPYFETLIAAEPAAEYYAGLAGCRLALRQLSEAATIITEGLDKYPNDPELYYYRAMLNRDRYRLDDAHADADRAVKLGLSPKKAKQLFTEKQH